jgi:hypothetical protein
MKKKVDLSWMATLFTAVRDGFVNGFNRIFGKYHTL